MLHSVTKKYLCIRAQQTCLRCKTKFEVNSEGLYANLVSYLHSSLLACPGHNCVCVSVCECVCGRGEMNCVSLQSYSHDSL